MKATDMMASPSVLLKARSESPEQVDFKALRVHFESPKLSAVSLEP